MHNLRLIILCGIVFLSTCVRAQVKSAQQQLGIYDLEQLDQLMVYIPGVGSASREDLLHQNIKSYMMPVRQVPNADMEWAYALADCLEFYVNLNNNFKDNLSPDFITMSLARAGDAPNLLDGLGLLIHGGGTVSAAIVPYNSHTIPNSVYSVPRFEIANFGYLFRPETRARNRIFETRKALSRGNPVLVELATDAHFLTLDQPNYSPNGAPDQTHYLTVVGYDGEDETFELRSGLGRAWGRGGYVRISYDDFGELARMGVVLIPGK